MLGAADGEGELATIFPDVYASEFGTTFPLEGKPLSIDAQHNYGIGSWNYTMGIMAPSPIAVLHIMTDSDLQLVRPSTLETPYNGRQMPWEPTRDNRSLWKLTPMATTAKWP